MLRILRVIPTLDPKAGGVAEAARCIDASLIALGVMIEVVCLDDPRMTSGDRFDYPATVHSLGPSRLGYRYNSILVPWLKANQARFDAVIVDGLWQYHGFAVWRALSKTSTPYFVFPHGMLDPWFKRAFPLKHIKKWLYWPWADFRLLRDARAVLFTCEEERRLAHESFWLYQCNEVVTSFGTATPPLNSRDLAGRFLKKYPELQDKRILLFLSRIHEKKGCDLLIDAFSRSVTDYPDLHLVMAGPDQTGWASKLKDQAEKLGIADRITWPGMLQGDDKWGAFHAAEVFCLPSHQENFGIVVAEAMACGKPVLISNKVNIWREIEADGAGIVRDDTAEGTETALRHWLGLPPAEQQAMREAATHSFNQRFRIDKVAQVLVDILGRESGVSPEPVFNDVARNS